MHSITTAVLLLLLLLLLLLQQHGACHTSALQHRAVLVTLPLLLQLLLLQLLLLQLLLTQQLLTQQLLLLLELLLCVRVTNSRRVVICETIKVHITTRAHCLPPWLCDCVYRQPCELSVKVVCRLAVRAVVSAGVQRRWDALAVGTHSVYDHN